MASNKKPRKRHKPKGVARPLTNDQRRDLDLAARVHANKLWNGTLDEQGWNTLAAHINVCATIANDNRFSPAVDVLKSILRRHAETGKYGATGDERRVFMEQFNQAVEYIGGRTDKQIAMAISEVIGGLK
jgi:hypothetical protein